LIVPVDDILKINHGSNTINIQINIDTIFTRNFLIIFLLVINEYAIIAIHITAVVNEKLLINATLSLGYDTFIIFHKPNFVNTAKYIAIYQNSPTIANLAKNTNANIPDISNNAVNLILNENHNNIPTNT
jgi:hypothetical protein